MDLWDKKKRSAVMAKIRSKDTKPELIVRRYLWSRGYRYRKNVRGLPGTPDIVLRKYGVVIFVHGCFWHGHEVDGTMPHTHTEFWRKKIERNKERDEKSKRALMRMGWMVITIWECQLKPKIRENTLMELEYVINHAYLERLRKKNVKSYRLEENEHSSGMAAEGVTEYGKASE
ncbi:dNA mismatch endonuclease Vsr [Bacteroides sp. CAG:462]|nr:dNA mismatch endonuclease Vsr [Bacteroides sp. CAG:462]